jgi:hypothetical protein
MRGIGRRVRRQLLLDLGDVPVRAGDAVGHDRLVRLGEAERQI